MFYIHKISFGKMESVCKPTTLTIELLSVAFACGLWIVCELRSKHILAIDSIIVLFVIALKDSVLVEVESWDQL
jgi:hypothetical protein